MEDNQQDICRVCRSEGSSDKPLYHPCVCTGSIKFIHQDCLVQWLKYSKKEYCELCKHKFAFKPIYAPDMPKRLPIQDILSGLLKSVGRAVRYWFHYTLVAVAWLGVVPLTACRIYRALFTGSVNSLLTLPLDMLSTDNLVSDSFQGCFVVTCTLCAFISLVWLREQILHGGGPEWLEQDQQPAVINNNRQPANNNNVVNNNIEDAGGGGDNQQAPDAQAGGGEVVAPPPPPPPPAAEDNGGGMMDAAVQQEDNWNPIEWDRAAEELTWERLLGLDGSLVFLEHVFWVVSLNTLFILVFAFCPYHIGHFTIVGLKMEEHLHMTQFEGLLTTLLGYWIISVSLVLLHCLASIFRFRRSDVISRSKRVLGLCYVVVKVSLLVVVEIGIFPLVCGWWLDICSLSMFDATLKERENSFRIAPGTSMFIHWLVGMVYVFYFASFILLLREVLRPGVLWFLRNLNDPDFNPIQEMIHLPIYRHVRRFLASMVIFGSTVLIMLWLPVKLIRWAMPTFLPYNVMLSSDAPVSELSLELLLLQVVLPALLEQGHTRHWLKSLVRGWCMGAAWLLDLRSYLLGDEAAAGDNPQQQQQEEGEAQEGGAEEGVAQEGGAEEGLAQEGGAEEGGAPAEGEEPDAAEPAPEAAAIPQEALVLAPAEEVIEAHEEEVVGAPVAPAPLPADLGDGGLGAAHQAMLQGGGPTGFQPYTCPNMFTFRLVCLFLLMCVTLYFASLLSYILPVYIGRRLMSIWMGEVSIHELYTAACGLYTCWLTLRAGTVLYHWLPQGAAAIFAKLREWAMVGNAVIVAKVRDWVMVVGKSVIVAVLLIGVVPLLLGLLFELVIVAPLRVPLDQTPVFFPWQDWALGVLHAKIICAVTMMGPAWWLRGVLERVYQQGLRQMDVGFILRRLCMPVLCVLSLCLAAPYVVARTIVPALGFDFDTCNLVLRRIYPFLLCVLLFSVFCVFQVKQFKKLYEHIKNDKYLVGQRLVNYERQQRIRALEPAPI